tara:strand:+ start:139 stop:468 length:330 start_codon:yes stop_codon:yes gene_type:complete
VLLVLQEELVLKVQLELREQREQEHKEQQVLKEQLELKVLEVLLGHRVHKELLEQLVVEEEELLFHTLVLVVQQLRHQPQLHGSQVEHPLKYSIWLVREWYQMGIYMQQ